MKKELPCTIFIPEIEIGDAEIMDRTQCLRQPIQGLLTLMSFGLKTYDIRRLLR
jgi:hypothetical protein